ncbi:hypothetical protein VFPPC_17726 [Pochonia chlamydosporia 170]|uniref:Uncharacterized protein n=1 Tax=Pochonia chlamydosporia 170 TaxID=1380566 RepID=A0A219AQP5_METCM|nr:hypothetical protein VFPPC_17726 [Pochonia chlamydosporia 170]OWT43098.1 hypothetical protein VFPPC_17726 [Pochonia chlamydosporia 170]
MIQIILYFQRLASSASVFFIPFHAPSQVRCSIKQINSQVVPGRGPSSSASKSSHIRTLTHSHTLTRAMCVPEA